MKKEKLPSIFYWLGVKPSKIELLKITLKRRFIFFVPWFFAAWYRIKKEIQKNRKWKKKNFAASMRKNLTFEVEEENKRASKKIRSSTRLAIKKDFGSEKNNEKKSCCGKMFYLRRIILRLVTILVIIVTRESFILYYIKMYCTRITV